MFFEKIFKQLEKRKIRYLVIGGVAVNLHGHARMTSDLDLMLSMDRENLKKFVKMVRSLGWRPRVPIAMEDFLDSKKRMIWVRDKNMKVFTVHNPDNPMEEIDIMIQGGVDFKKAYQKKMVFSEGNLKVSAASISDLIDLKKAAGRGKDLLDIQVLKEIRTMKNEKEK